MAKADDPRDVHGVDAGAPIRGPWLTGVAKGLDDERRKPPPLPRVPGLRGFFATITTVTGDGAYEFEERHLPEWDAELKWLTPEGNTYKRTGDCYELNGNDELEEDDEVFLFEVRGKDGKLICIFLHPPEGEGGGGSGLIKITTATGSLKGDLKESGTAMSSWDDNGGSHYDVTDEGSGVVKVGDVFPAFLDSGGTWHIASIYHRLKDV